MSLTEQNCTGLNYKIKSLFDQIYMISYLPYEDRRKKFMNKDYFRIFSNSYDDFDDLFSIYYTVPNPFDAMLLETPYFKSLHEHNMRFNQGALNLAMGHYHVMKEALGLGMRRILILEDDVAFLKDIDTIVNMLDNFPGDGNIVLFDKVCPMHMKSEYEQAIENKINDYYAPYDHNLILWTTGCLALDRGGMEHIIECQEKAFNVADYYTNYFVPVPGKMIRYPFNLKTYFSIKSIVCQRPDNKETISDHGQKNSVYNQNGLYDCERDTKRVCEDIASHLHPNQSPKAVLPIDEN